MTQVFRQISYLAVMRKTLFKAAIIGLIACQVVIVGYIVQLDERLTEMSEATGSRAASLHKHSPTDLRGLATVGHAHDYADGNHSHDGGLFDDGYAKESHTHEYADGNHNHDGVFGYAKELHGHLEFSSFAASTHQHSGFDYWLSSAIESHTHDSYDFWLSSAIDSKIRKHEIWYH